MRRLIVSTFASLDASCKHRRTGRRPNRRFYPWWLDVRVWGRKYDISASGFDGKNREVVLGAGPMRYSKRTGLSAG